MLDEFVKMLQESIKVPAYSQLPYGIESNRIKVRVEELTADGVTKENAFLAAAIEEALNKLR